MITGIIFVCMVGEGFCQPVFKKFDTVEECILETAQVVDKLEDTTGMVFYTLCDPDGEPL